MGNLECGFRWCKVSSFVFWFKNCASNLNFISNLSISITCRTLYMYNLHFLFVVNFVPILGSVQCVHGSKLNYWTKLKSFWIWKKLCQNQNHKGFKIWRARLKPKPMEPMKTKFNIKTKTKCCLKKKRRTSQQWYLHEHAC